MEPVRADIPDMCALFKSGQIWHHQNFPDIFCLPENEGRITAYFHRYFAPKKSVLKPRSLFHKQSRFSLGWFRDDTLRGYILYSLYKGSDVFFGDDIWFAHVDDIAVDANHRQGGIASGLLDVLTGKIDARGGGIISAQVWNRNTSSEKLFLKAGFERNCTQYHRTS